MQLSVSEKRQLIWAGATVLALVVLWLLIRRPTTTIIENKQLGDNIFGGVTIPDFDFGDFSLPISIPGLNVGKRDLQMISGCCSDCNGSTPIPDYSASRAAVNLTFITNEGSAGPRYYNTTTQGVPRQPQRLVYGNSASL